MAELYFAQHGSKVLIAIDLQQPVSLESEKIAYKMNRKMGSDEVLSV